MSASRHHRQIGIVTGLAAETRIARRALAGSFSETEIEDRLVCAAAKPARARASAEQLCDAGARALLSFGVAGGLDEGLSPGDLVLADRVILPDGQTVSSGTDWHASVMDQAAAAGLRLHTGALVGSDTAVAGVRAKRALRQDTGALAVDMESHLVAEVAAARGLPFLVLRAVADPVGHALPRIAMGALDDSGHPRKGLVMLRLCRRPWELPALRALNRSFKSALTALERAATDLGAPLLRGL